MTKEIQIKVQIADKTGHSQVLMSPAAAVEEIQRYPTRWVYADNQIIDPNQVDEANLSTVSSVRIVAGLVGGC